MSDSVRPHRRQPTRLLCPWDSPGKNTGVGCHFLLQCMKAKRESEVAQLCLTLSDPMDCSLPGSSIHGIFQARVLEWVAIAFSGMDVEFYQIPFLHLLKWLCGFFFSFVDVVYVAHGLTCMYWTILMTLGPRNEWIQLHCGIWSFSCVVRFSYFLRSFASIFIKETGL